MTIKEIVHERQRIIERNKLGELFVWEAIEFIQNYVPNLLDEIERLTAENKQVKIDCAVAEKNHAEAVRDFEIAETDGFCKVCLFVDGCKYKDDCCFMWRERKRLK